MAFTKQQIAKAIDQEAADWAKFFDVEFSDVESLEGRKSVMRANVAGGYFNPLLPYLDTSFFSFYPAPDGRRISYGAHIGKSLASDSRWIIPGTCRDDPEFERGYAMLNYARAHRWQYWLGQYPA